MTTRELDRARGEAVSAYDQARARVHAARKEMDRVRSAAVSVDLDRATYWLPALALATTPSARFTPPADEARAAVRELLDAVTAADAALQDLYQAGLHPENWTS